MQLKGECSFVESTQLRFGFTLRVGTNSRSQNSRISGIESTEFGAKFRNITGQQVFWDDDIFLLA